MTEDFDPTALSLTALAQAYASGLTDPLQATDAYLAAIAAKNPELNAYLAVMADAAVEAARASAERWQAGKTLGPLDGAPIAIKDNIDIAGLQTTNGCDFGPVANADADVIRRLKAAGAVILGKLNQHELALGATTDNPHHGPAHNPARIGITPGGSSGGSGAAVAAGMAAAALGTDTMGSVRIPAAYCGCYGIKPTFGLVSNDGVSPLAHALDHVGPLARAPEDLEAMLTAMAISPLDRTPFALDGLHVGRVKEIEAAETAREMRQAYERFLHRLEEAGARLIEMSWAGLDLSRARRAGLLVSEADSAAAYAEDLARRPYRFSPEIRAMLAYGRDAKPAKIEAARAAIRTAGETVNASFASVDVIATPTAPMPPFEFASPPPANQADFTAPANFAGCPAIALPAGETPGGLPLGVQLMAPKGRDAGLIGLATDLAAA